MSVYLGLQWHVTNKCDQRCQHCYIWQSNKKKIQSVMSIEDCKLIVESFITFVDRIPIFTITGGDPLLYPQFWDLLKIIQKNGFKFNILGNPFHLNIQSAKMLKELGCDSYQMSLDGLEETHDSIRKRGSFQATVSALSILQQVGIDCLVMSTVSQLNYKELPELARFCMNKGVNGYSFARYCPNSKETKDNLTPKLYRQFLSDMWSIYNENPNRDTTFILKDHLWTAFLYEEGLIQRICDEMGSVDEGCSCARNGITLLPDGSVYACRRFESFVGNIYDQSFSEIWSSNEMNEYRQVDKLEGCKDCELQLHCRGCHAVSATTTGSYFDKDPQCWRC